MKIKAVLLLVVALAFAASPLMVPGFGGYEPSQFPALEQDPPILPAGYAFALWGVIYLWLIVMAGFGLIRRDLDAEWDATRLPLIISIGIGSVWLPVALVSPLWATVLIWAMLAAALAGLIRTPQRDLWLLRAPVGLYAGWLTAASCVSLGTLLVGFAIPPFGPVGWSVAMLALALAITVVLLRARPSLMYGAAVVWALIAVTVRDGATLVGLLALGAAVLVAALTFLRLRSLRSSRPRPAGRSAPR
ncbi:hypothetical protein [Jannaschia rubra]|uniref:hypothetical protein n=1 Tax=Jannaschia rubra TaxID=282197 RepID=UPI002491E328|nr:hypothetical protein [Jannaschia rubra]